MKRDRSQRSRGSHGVVSIVPVPNTSGYDEIIGKESYESSVNAEKMLSCSSIELEGSEGMRSISGQTFNKRG